MLTSLKLMMAMDFSTLKKTFTFMGIINPNTISHLIFTANFK